MMCLIKKGLVEAVHVCKEGILLSGLSSICPRNTCVCVRMSDNSLTILSEADWSLERK